MTMIGVQRDIALGATGYYLEVQEVYIWRYDITWGRKGHYLEV